MARPGTLPNVLIIAGVAAPIAASRLWALASGPGTGNPPFTLKPLWLSLLLRGGPIVALFGVGLGLRTLLREPTARTPLNYGLLILGAVAAGILVYSVWFIAVN